jgi:hypothetical protein
MWKFGDKLEKLIHQKRIKNSDESNLMNEEQRNNWLGLNFIWIKYIKIKKVMR